MRKFLIKVINKLLRANLPPARYAVKLKRKYRIRSFERSDKKVLEICGGIMPLSKENINVLTKSIKAPIRNTYATVKQRNIPKIYKDAISKFVGAEFSGKY